MTLKKWAHHWKANKILHKKLLSKISLFILSSKWVKFYLFFIKLIKKFSKNVFNLLKINLNFTWKYFLIQNFMSFPMVCSLFESHFPFESYRRICLVFNEIMWYRVFFVEESWGEKFMWYKYFSTCYKVRPLILTANNG